MKHFLSREPIYYVHKLESNDINESIEFILTCDQILDVVTSSLSKPWVFIAKMFNKFFLFRLIKSDRRRFNSVRARNNMLNVAIPRTLV